MPSDIVAALQWQAEQDMHCSECGESLVESMKKENSFAYRAEALWCHGCRAIHRASVKMSGGKEDPSAGTRYRLHRIDNGAG